MKRYTLLLFIAIGMAAFYVLENFIPGGRVILYPFKLLVTMLHEFGHAMGAVVTGGDVDSIKINADGSGWCKTAGGSRGIILMGGYIGSALFGNFLLYMGFVYQKSAKWVLYGLALVLIIISTIWSADITNTAFVLAFLIGIMLINRTKYNYIFLMLLGVLSVAHIINDFNVGPTSDLSKFAEVWPFLSATAWMYVWLVFAVGITGITVNRMLKTKPNTISPVYSSNDLQN
ncbi:MAG: M50 family metallopeptidase [bacterium]|nr:M50 family metallopeptidase [bacterium]